MPGRKYDNGSEYRYGFNGKEKDNSTGEGNLDFGARVLDVRLGRWLSVDPLQQKYPGLSTYQFCANKPISAKDPDGRLIIFINGMWTPFTNVNAPLEPYWISNDPYWIRDVQNKIGDHAKPRFYDGSLGGFDMLHGRVNTNMVLTRETFGQFTGLRDAPEILRNLKKGETIKIVTNSMGTAFARGFTKGVLEYVDKQNKIIEAYNKPINDEISSLETDNLILNMSIKTQANPIPQMTPYTPGELKALEQLGKNYKRIDELKANLKSKLSVEFEMEVDLSSHQVDYADENVKNSYYMITDNLAPAEKAFVEQKKIKGATELKKMDRHHSSGASANNFPSASSPDPNPRGN